MASLHFRCRWPSPLRQACHRRPVCTRPLWLGFLISALGGSRTQIGGPTGAFVVIIAGIVVKFGLGGLALVGIMASILLLVMGSLASELPFKYIPRPVTIGFTNGIALLIASTQIKDFLGERLHRFPVRGFEPGLGFCDVHGGGCDSRHVAHVYFSCPEDRDSASFHFSFTASYSLKDLSHFNLVSRRCVFPREKADHQCEYCKQQGVHRLGSLFLLRPAGFRGLPGGFLALLGGHLGVCDLCAHLPQFREIAANFRLAHEMHVTTMRGGHAKIIIDMRGGREQDCSRS